MKKFEATLRKILKKLKLVRILYTLSLTLKNYFNFRPLKLMMDITWYYKDFIDFKKSAKAIGKHFDYELYPCLLDKTTHIPVDPVYFYQDTWAARHIYKIKPKNHVDIGSSFKTIGILSQFVPITYIDIRPPELLELPNLTYVKASILNLPFPSESLESISCLCVVEHIGLGRYGDEIDPDGTEKAIEELKRVLKKGGVFVN